jgi:hypothetical protein
MSDIGNWMTQRVAEDHRAEMFKQARNDRVVREVLAANRKQRTLYAPLLARLGDRLIAAGRYLKRRYGTSPHDYAAPRLSKSSTG